MNMKNISQKYVSENPMEKFKHQRKFAPKGPLVRNFFTHLFL